MCGQGHDPFSTRSGQNLQDLLKENKNSGIAFSFIYLSIFFGLNGVGVGVFGKWKYFWACTIWMWLAQVGSVDSIRSSRKEIS